MTFDRPLVFGKLLRRYKRFLADVELEPNGERVTASCPNTGSMRGCAEPGWRVALTHAPSATRKYAHTWELTHDGKGWIGINTGRTNALAEAAILAGRIPELAGYTDLLREQRYGVNSRIDLLLGRAGQRCYVEVKNVTLRTADGCVAFPDAVTTRGAKHLVELSQMVRDGHRAVMFYVAQRADGDPFRLAGEIDSAYAAAFKLAREAGVEAIAYAADVSPTGIVITRKLKMVIGQ